MQSDDCTKSPPRMRFKNCYCHRALFFMSSIVLDDWVIEVESPSRIPPLLQRPQSLQPPRLIPIELLHRLIPICIISICIVLPWCFTINEQLPTLTAIFGGNSIVGSQRRINHRIRDKYIVISMSVSGTSRINGLHALQRITLELYGTAPEIGILGHHFGEELVDLSVSSHIVRFETDRKRDRRLACST